jgi:TusA-related sulfurtransferase
MDSEKVIKINARGLSSPGPRLMVETALEKGPFEMLRVVVSNRAAALDLEQYLTGLKAKVEIDVIGEEYHILAAFEKPQENPK